MSPRVALSWRVRAYVATLAFRHVGLGLALLDDRDAFRSATTFRYVFRILPISAWAATLVAFGIVALGGVLWPREIALRIVIVGSVFFSFMWAGSFVAANLIYPHGAASSFAAVVFVSLALGDLTVSGVPYGKPLERLLGR